MKDEIEQHWRDLGSFIRDQRHVGQLSLRKLSEMAGISNPYLSQIERGLRKPSAEILRQIASALHISAETLYVRAGILDEPGAPADLIAEIRRSPDLNEEHKRALVHLYEMFQREHAESMDRRAGEDAADDATDDAAGIDGTGDSPGAADRGTARVDGDVDAGSGSATAATGGATGAPKKTPPKKAAPKKAAVKSTAAKKSAPKKKVAASRTPAEQPGSGD